MIRLFYDIECYRNYFLVTFLAENGKSRSFEMYEDIDLDRDGLAAVLMNPNVELVSFNGNKYDLPMITLALQGATCDELKQASDTIITDELWPWEFERRFQVKLPSVNHIDLIEVAPGMQSLKIYGGRIHCPTLQDLPIPHDARITPKARQVLLKYCLNDVRVTQLLFRKLEKQIDLRRTMSREYGVDLRSKSDAQIAEAVLRAEVSKRKGYPVSKVSVQYTAFNYEPPEYVRFSTPYLQERLEVILEARMVVNDTGHVDMPKAIEEMDIQIGGTSYTIGIGGLHSKESEVCHLADENTLLIDRDVVSYYPSMMVNMKMCPPAFGDDFLVVFKRILDERVAAKHAGDKVKADALKIVLNGTFGKTSSRYSYLYNPELMIRTTLTGQLSLLMLVELLEEHGIRVVSANTDGVVIKCDRAEEALLAKLVSKWERMTNLETEETRYTALYSRDVNNYIAFKEDGSVKVKGVYATSTLAKNPQNEICTEAVIAYLRDKVPYQTTIRGCKDIRKLLSLRKVNGGAVKGTAYLGKAVRWYYADGVAGEINYKTNGNRVSRTEGAKPLMVLPEAFPDDVDHMWYEMECRSILMDIGAMPRPPVVKLPRKNSKAWKAAVESGAIVPDGKDKWRWATV